MRRSPGLALSALFLVAFPALAQDPATHTAPAPGGVAVFLLAQDLYQAGLAQKDALSVLAAARLLATVELQKGEELQKTGGGAVADSTPPPADPEAMLASASALAGEDDLILSQLERASVEARHSTPVTVIFRLSDLAAGQSEVWQVPFFGNTPSELAIAGNGLSNLDVTVADATGAPLCLDLSAQDRMRCGFVGQENGFVQVTVTNRGDQDNRYYLLTN